MEIGSCFKENKKLIALIENKKLIALILHFWLCNKWFPIAESQCGIELDSFPGRSGCLRS